MGLGFGAEDCREMAPVVDEVDTDGVTTMGGAGERPKKTRSKKTRSPIAAEGLECILPTPPDTQDPKNDFMRSMSALTSGEYWAKVPWLRTVLSASSLELATEDSAVDLFFGEERWVGRGYKEASGRRWGHEHGWAGPYIVGLEGAGKEMLARWVDDCRVQCCR